MPQPTWSRIYRRRRVGSSIHAIGEESASVVFAYRSLAFRTGEYRAHLRAPLAAALLTEAAAIVSILSALMKAMRVDLFIGIALVGSLWCFPSLALSRIASQMVVFATDLERAAHRRRSLRRVLRMRVFCGGPSVGAQFATCPPGDCRACRRFDPRDTRHYDHHLTGVAQDWRGAFDALANAGDLVAGRARAPRSATMGPNSVMSAGDSVKDLVSRVGLHAETWEDSSDNGFGERMPALEWMRAQRVSRGSEKFPGPLQSRPAIAHAFPLPLLARSAETRRNLVVFAHRSHREQMRVAYRKDTSPA